MRKFLAILHAIYKLIVIMLFLGWILPGILLAAYLTFIYILFIIGWFLDELKIIKERYKKNDC